MKKTVTKEICVCDECGDEAYYQCFGGCGKHFCFDHGIHYKHGVCVSGSGDGCYCNECHARRLENEDPELLAYQEILVLKADSEAFYAGWNKRREAVEALLTKFYKARRKNRNSPTPQ